MKVNSLHLKDYRGHADTQLAFDKITILVGPNAAGKTSIKSAIELALTGRNQFTDAAGRGVDTQIRGGAKKAVIELDIDGTALVRTIGSGAGLAIQGFNGPAGAQQDAFLAKYDVTPDLVAAAIHSSEFIGMKPDEQKNLLFRLADLNVDHTVIKGLTAQALGKVPDIFDQVFDSLWTQTGPTGGPEVFDALEKAAREERRVAKKRLQEKQSAGITMRLPELPAGFTLEMKPDAEKHLANLVAERDQANREVGEARANQARLQDIKTRQERAVARKRQAKAELEAVNPFVAPEVLEKAAVPLVERINELQANVNGLSEAAAERRAKIAAGEELLAALAKVGGKCPLSAQLDCAMTPIQVQAVKADVEKGMESARANLRRIESELSDARRAVEFKQVEAKSSMDRADEARKMASRKVQLEQTIADAEREATELAEQANAIKTVDPAAAEEKLTGLTERVTKGQGIIRALDDYARGKAALDAMEAEVKRLQAEVNLLESLVEILGPKGLKAKLLSQMTGDIEARANARLDTLTGGQYQVRLDLSDGFAILVSHHGATLPLKELSTSERLRVGIALQDVLNSFTGLGLLIIDDAETLDFQNRQLLMATVQEIADQYDTIIILASRGEVEPTDPGVPGLAVYIVENGTVRRAPQAVAA